MDNTTSLHAEHIQEMANRMRRRGIELGHQAGHNGAHFGGGLSCMEILAVLYGEVMSFKPDDPLWEGRDRFILSKGHGTLAYYTALYESGLITDTLLDTFEQNGGLLPGQPAFNPSLGIESSSGSLGMGLSFGCGIALALKKKGLSESRVYVLVGDGECDEGSVWEAAMAAVHLKLDNITCIVDANGLQSDGSTGDIMGFDIAKAWRGFSWDVFEADGHDITDLMTAFEGAEDSDGPSVVIAHTVKGKGISFMENNPAWHHGVLSAKQYDMAIEECGGDVCDCR